ncbi:MAG: glycoside hydrolase family 3 C-terminal domain-containing protein, partial [Actinomycetota bacterium]
MSDDRAVDGVRPEILELSLERCVELLSGSGFWTSEAIPELDLPSITLTDGPHGVRRQPADADHIGIGQSVPATCFPTASLLGATWDSDLLAEVGAALGVEARAGGVGVLLGPGLNLKRHPAGGRSFEYLSEDPLLSGRLAAALIRGIQSEGVAACPKHFVANNHESYRMVVDCVIDPRTLHELYLRGFEIAVREGDPWALMTSYNKVDGAYVGESPDLVDGLLRDRWGFDGMVVTDWAATSDRVGGVAAGVDLEMPSSGGAFDGEVLAAVDDGELDESVVRRRVENVARLVERCVAGAERPTDLDEVAHHRLARRVAAEGTVLLANDGVLPIADDVEVALLGAFAETPRYQGAGSSQVVPTRLDDARRVFEERMVGRVRYDSIYDPDTGDATADDIRRAADLAHRAHVAVVVIGLPPIAEAEGVDRDTLALPTAMNDLVTAVCAANPRTVVVLANGAPVLLPWADRPAAVVEAYLGGQASGSALVDVLVGDAEPAGRLAESFPASMVFPSETCFERSTRQVRYRETLHVGYRFHTTGDVSARFPFGHGLSYAEFVWGDASIDRDPDDAGRTGTDLEGRWATVRVPVTNTSDRAGSEVVQVYARRPESGVYRVDRELVGFAKVRVAAGETVEAIVDIDRRLLGHFDAAVGEWVVEDGEVELLVAASSVDVRSRVRAPVAGSRVAVG